MFNGDDYLQQKIKNSNFGKKLQQEEVPIILEDQSQKTNVSVIEEINVHKDFNQDQLKIEVALQTNDLETFKSAIEENAKFHHLMI